MICTKELPNNSKQAKNKNTGKLVKVKAGYSQTKSQHKDEWVFRELMGEEIRAILLRLDSQERDIISLRYALDNGIIKTPSEIAQMLNLSSQEIKQIRKRAINKLRRFYSASEYEAYLV